MEQSEKIEEGKLKQIAEALGVETEAIKLINEDAVVNYTNTFYDNSTSAFNNLHCTFNPIDKIFELCER